MKAPLTRLAFISSINDETLDDATSPELAIRYADISDVSQGQPVRWKAPMEFVDAPLRARRLVRHGDVLISTVRPYLRAITPVEGPPKNAVVSTGFAVLRPRQVSPEFLGYAVQTHGFVDEVVSRSVGVSYPAVSASDIGRIKIPVPDRDTQDAIADYLDHETAEIDTLIADNQELIRLFNERRAAAIHAALEADYTRFVPLKHLGSLRSGIALGSRYDGELYEFPYLRVANVQTDHVDLHDVATVRVPRSVAVNNRLEAGDILMTEGGDRDKLGRGALWEGQIPDALHQNHIFSFRCGDELTPDYLVLVLESARARRYFDETARQSTNLASTNSRTVKAFEIPWRPVEEQARLVTALDSDIRDMRTATNDSHRAIELAQERHTALISAAVTGQIDVTQKHRPVAEQLEDEVKQLS